MQCTKSRIKVKKSVVLNVLFITINGRCLFGIGTSRKYHLLTMRFCFEGADITDYFNYGFTEDSWKQYCERQRRLRMEISGQKKIYVRNMSLFTKNISYLLCPLMELSQVVILLPGGNPT